MGTQTESRVEAEFALIDLVETAKNVENTVGNFLNQTFVFCWRKLEYLDRSSHWRDESDRNLRHLRNSNLSREHGSSGSDGKASSGGSDDFEHSSNQCLIKMKFYYSFKLGNDVTKINKFHDNEFIGAVDR